MCVSHHNIDQISYHIAEQIVQFTIYRPLHIELIGEGRFAIEAGQPFPTENHGVISKIVLADKGGNLYRIEPDEIGLKFARGEIDYKEYLNQQKKGKPATDWSDTRTHHSVCYSCMGICFTFLKIGMEK